jgi:hypothetical protein
MLILSPKFRFWALKAYFSFFDPWKYIYSSSIKKFRSMDISHDHTDFEPQIPFLGSEGLFLPFWPTKLYNFFIYIKFPIDGHITRPFQIPFLGSEGLFSKSIFFLTPCKILDHIDFGAQIPFWALSDYFCIFDL